MSSARIRSHTPSSRGVRKWRRFCGKRRRLRIRALGGSRPKFEIVLRCHALLCTSVRHQGLKHSGFRTIGVDNVDRGLNCRMLPEDEGVPLSVTLGPRQPRPVRWQTRPGRACQNPSGLSMFCPSMAAAPEDSPRYAYWMPSFATCKMILQSPCPDHARCAAN